MPTLKLRKEIEKLIVKEIRGHIKSYGTVEDGCPRLIDKLLSLFLRTMKGILPEKKYVTEHTCNSSDWCLIPECNFNRAIAEIQKKLDELS